MCVSRQCPLWICIASCKWLACLWVNDRLCQLVSIAMGHNHDVQHPAVDSVGAVHLFQSSFVASQVHVFAVGYYLLVAMFVSIFLPCCAVFCCEFHTVSIGTT